MHHLPAFRGQPWSTQGAQETYEEADVFWL
jgi:hypothetical protein